MEQYIPKSVVLAEIKKYKKEALERLTTSIERPMRRQIKDKAWVSLCQNLLSVIDTLEVKEVDLDEEIKNYFKGFGKFASVGIDDCIDIAKHFYELGMKMAQKGEEV